MTLSCPVSASLGGAAPTFVVDAGFALSPMGLLVTMALATRAAVWLPRGLLTLLDNDQLYRRAPERMGGNWLAGGDDAGLRERMVAELPGWQRAWHYGKLSARVHWIGDARFESALPARENLALLPRFEQAAAALDDRRAGQGNAVLAPLDECARDAVALAAALQPEPAWLLTLPESRAGLPPLCTFLAEHGLGVRQRDAGRALPQQLDAALVPLEAAGCQAALVQIVAPGVLTLADDWDSPDWSSGVDAESGEADVWRHACALWQPFAVAAVAA